MRRKTFSTKCCFFIDCILLLMQESARQRLQPSGSFGRRRHHNRRLQQQRYRDFSQSMLSRRNSSMTGYSKGLSHSLKSPFISIQSKWRKWMLNNSNNRIGDKENHPNAYDEGSSQCHSTTTTTQYCNTTTEQGHGNGTLLWLVILWSLAFCIGLMFTILDATAAEIGMVSSQANKYGRMLSAPSSSTPISKLPYCNNSYLQSLAERYVVLIIVVCYQCV